MARRYLLEALGLEVRPSSGSTPDNWRGDCSGIRHHSALLLPKNEFKRTPMHPGLYPRFCQLFLSDARHGT